MEEMILRYSKGLDEPLNGVKSAAREPFGHVVLLTGSTGNLGALILAMLLSNQAVARVYALNRPSSQASTLERHIKRFEDKTLDTSALSSEKLVFLEGETSNPHLGLTDHVYNEVCGQN